MKKLFFVSLVLMSMFVLNCVIEEPDRSGPSCTPLPIFDGKDKVECWDVSEYCHFCSYVGESCTTVAECYNNPDLGDDIWGVWNKKYTTCN
jgi:hypothetical protein